MHRSHYILGNEAMKREYKKYLNKLTKIKSIAKKQYFTDELEKNKSNQRKTWEILRSLLPGKLTNLPVYLSLLILMETKLPINKQYYMNLTNFFSRLE